MIECSLNYCDSTGNVWFHSKDEKKVFNAISTNTDVFKSFKYKTKLIENTVAQLAPNADNEILENATECIFGHHWNFTCLWFIAK